MGILVEGVLVNNSPVTIVGNLTRDPDVTSTTGGHKKATFGVAVEHRFMRNGEWDSNTSFFQVVAWRYLAEDIERVLAKGTRVIVTGRLEQRNWEDNDGNRRSVVELSADEVGLALRHINSFDKRSGSGSGGTSPSGSFSPPDEDPWP